MRRVVEIAVTKRLSELNTFLPNQDLLSEGLPIGGNRKSATEVHWVRSCDEEWGLDFHNWVDSCIDDTINFRLYGCFEYEVHPYKIDRKFIGISLYLPETSDGLRFQVAWAELSMTAC